MVAGSPCATWTQDFSRVQITTTDVYNKKKFKVELVQQNILLGGGTCYYYVIKTVADSGCLQTKPYWMTFVDNTTTTSGTQIPYLKWYLNPVPASPNPLVKRAAAFDLTGFSLLPG